MLCSNGAESVKHSSVGFGVRHGLNNKSASDLLPCNTLISGLSGGVQVQSNAVVLGALSADTAPITSGTVERDEFDLDLPSEGFSSIPEAIEDILKGKVVLHVDVVIFTMLKNFT